MTLETWRAIADDTTRVVACCGDSTTQHGWPEVLAQIARGRWGYGGAGFRGTWRDDATEWVYTGTWTDATTADAWDVGPFVGGLSGHSAAQKANGSANIAKWTKPADVPPVAGFDLLVVDGASSANFAYRIDGGSWTDVSATWSQGNALKRITIATAVTSTVEVRGANAAGTAVNVYLVGLEPACSTTGLTVHNLGNAGAFSNQVIRTGSGDWTSWFALETPDVATILFVNDLSLWNATQYQSRLESWCSDLDDLGCELIIFSYFEWADVDLTDFAEKQTIEESVASTAGAAYFDLNDLAGGGHSGQVAAGYFIDDEVHPSDKGNRFIADHMWNLLGHKTTADKLVRT